MSFSDKIKKILELEEINLRVFSDLTEIRYDTVRQYSSGRRSPTFDQIQKILAVPQFEKYKEFLLSDGSSIGELPMGDPTGIKKDTLARPQDPLTTEALELIKRLEALGKGEEALAILRSIEEIAKK